MAETTQPPKKIKLDRSAKRLVIDWSDGFRSSYPWAYLRSQCPSAGERTARENRDPNPLALLTKVPSDEIVDVRMAGVYAINFTWADGHNVGIYTWEYLRELADDQAVKTTAIV